MWCSFAQIFPKHLEHKIIFKLKWKLCYISIYKTLLHLHLVEILNIHDRTNWKTPALFTTSYRNELTNSMRIVHNPDTKFCRDQNYEHFKILVPTWHAVTTGLHIRHASLRLVCALAPLEASHIIVQVSAWLKTGWSFNSLHNYTV